MTTLIGGYWLWKKYNDKVGLWFLWLSLTTLVFLGWKYISTNIIHLSSQVQSINSYLNVGFNNLSIILIGFLLIKTWTDKE